MVSLSLGPTVLRPKTSYCKLQKTLSLQQCLSVVRHYESLKLHIQQIRPDKSIEYLRHHSGKKRVLCKENKAALMLITKTLKEDARIHGPEREHGTKVSQTGSQPLSNLTKFLPGNKCIGCSRNRYADHLRECPAQGKSCNKCGRLHHIESVCGMIPSRRSQSRPGRSVNELNQNNSLMSFPRNSEHENPVNMVPKQILDVVNSANSGMNSGKNL